MRPGDGDPLLTPAEVVRIFGVRTVTVTRWAREGKIPYSLTPGGHRRYCESAIRALWQEQRPQSPQGPDAKRQLTADAVRMYEEGWSIRQVADKFDVSFGVMRRLLRKHTKLRPMGAPGYQRKPDPPES